jgi:hypothetical protein
MCYGHRLFSQRSIKLPVSARGGPQKFLALRRYPRTRKGTNYILSHSPVTILAHILGFDMNADTLTWKLCVANNP